ncbi:hypothetical protein RA210_U70050 [Rubrivivax sp. A210]|nr:hypothetical protein RA210_U70050 [Rubrivivax sp. A210]
MVRAGCSPAAAGPASPQQSHPKGDRQDANEYRRRLAQSAQGLQRA